MTSTRHFFGTTAALFALSLPSIAQAPAQPTEQPTRPHPPTVTKTFFLKNISEYRGANEIDNAIRNMVDPTTRIYFLPSENALVVDGTPDQIDKTARLLSDFDLPQRAYRLTYTVTTFDNKERIGTEHFSMVLVTGQHAVLKQGSKVPIVIGTSKPETGGSNSQVTYLDIGMNFDATLSEFATGVRLQSKIEQSSIAPEQSSVGAADPVIRQTVLEGTSILTPNKPLILGSLDIPGSTRHVDLTVTMEPAT